MGELVQRKGRFVGWEYSEEMATGTNSDPIPIPPIGNMRTMSVTLVDVSSGTGKIQITTSPDASVEGALGAPPAVWQDWEAGSVTDTTNDSLVSPVSAVRLVRTSGTVGIEIII